MDKLLPWLLSAGGGAIAGNIVGLMGRLRSLAPLLKTLLGAVGGVAGYKLADMTRVVPSTDALHQAGIGAGVGALVTGLLGSMLVRKPR